MFWGIVEFSCEEAVVVSEIIGMLMGWKGGGHFVEVAEARGRGGLGRGLRGGRVGTVAESIVCCWGCSERVEGVGSLLWGRVGGGEWVEA